MGGGGSKAKIKQQIMNSVKTENITETLVKNINRTSISTNVIQNLEVDTEGCVFEGNTNIYQATGITGKVISVTDSTINQEAINDIQSKMKTELNAATKQIDEKTLPLPSGKQKSDIEQYVSNVLDTTIRSTVTQETVSEQLSNNNIFQTNKFKCKNTVFKQDFKLGQDAQVDISMTNLLNSVVDQVIDNKTVVDMVTKAKATITQEKTDAFAMLFKYLPIIIGLLIVLVVVGGIIYFMVTSKSNSGGGYDAGGGGYDAGGGGYDAGGGEYA